MNIRDYLHSLSPSLFPDELEEAINGAFQRVKDVAPENIDINPVLIGYNKKIIEPVPLSQPLQGLSGEFKILSGKINMNTISNDAANIERSRIVQGIQRIFYGTHLEQQVGTYVAKSDLKSVFQLNVSGITINILNETRIVQYINHVQSLCKGPGVTHNQRLWAHSLLSAMKTVAQKYTGVIALFGIAAAWALRQLSKEPTADIV